MKRTRSQQLKAPSPPPPAQDPATDADAGNHPKPQRRAKQPRQPNKGGNEPFAATPVVPDEAAAPVVPDVSPRASGWEEDLDDAGLGLNGLNGGAWWSWGVDEDKLLGWFPFVEEDFRCPGGGRGAGDADVDFDDDIWRIHQIHEIPNYAANK